VNPRKALRGIVEEAITRGVVFREPVTSVLHGAKDRPIHLYYDKDANSVRVTGDLGRIDETFRLTADRKKVVSDPT
jgi:hypothetical protein